MIQHTKHVLSVPDLATSAEFYRDVMKFEIYDVGDPCWRLYKLGDCQILAGECANAIHPNELGDHSYFAYFVVNDVNHYYKTVVSNGAEVIKPLSDEPWGMREFSLKTIDGHRIMIGQEKNT